MPKREIGQFDQVRGNQDLGTKIFEKLSKNKIFLAENVIRNFASPEIFSFISKKQHLEADLGCFCTSNRLKRLHFIQN